MYQNDGFVNYPPPFMPSPFTSLGSNFQKESSPSPSSPASKISPTVLFIIVILSLLFFIAGLLHFLVRFLTKNPSSSPTGGNLEASNTDALQRQLQQLFNLHDSGLDQAFIDALPVFSYKEIVGPKQPLDCAVCLSEFSDTDQLRLLPVCGHAFHISCIDTWLLSNSTCPLCRGILFENPIFDFDDLREDDGFPGYREHRSNTALKRLEVEEVAQGNGVFTGYGEHGSNTALERLEIEEVAQGKGVFPVRLGKFRKVDDEKGDVGDETSSSKLDGRRCYSMGSYQYVVGDVNLSVSLSEERSFQEPKLVKRREEPSGFLDDEGTLGKTISIGTKTDSYSISKIWLWSNKGTFASSSVARLDTSSHSPNMDLAWMHRTDSEGV